MVARIRAGVGATHHSGRGTGPNVMIPQANRTTSTLLASKRLRRRRRRISTVWRWLRYVRNMFLWHAMNRNLGQVVIAFCIRGARPNMGDVSEAVVCHLL